MLSMSGNPGDMGATRRQSRKQGVGAMSFEPPVGVIGIGLMGEVFARRLVAAGFGVAGFDVDPDKTARLAEFGAHPAASIGDVARAANPIVLAVFDTGQVEQVVEELVPVLAATGGKRKVVLCTSTCDPDRVAALAERAEERGLCFLETPVSGTSEQVREGDGVLHALFPRRFHVGRVGDGGRTKLAVNLILGLNRMALAEGLVFATRLGLEPDAFLKVAQASAAYSQVMDTKGRKMIASDFRPEGRARQTLKDVHLMLAQAEKIGQPLPLLRVHCEALEACVRNGEGDLDNSVVVQEIRRRGERKAMRPLTRAAD